MAKKTVTLTESEMRKLIENVVNELMNETGGWSMGVSKRFNNDYKRASANGINYIVNNKGKVYDVEKRSEQAEKDENKARVDLLSLFANEPFVFTADMLHSNTHIISYKVTDIVAVRNQEVLLEGEWYDWQDKTTQIKRIKVDCNTFEVKYYSHILKSPNAIINTDTKTKRQWDSFVRELVKVKNEYHK